MCKLPTFTNKNLQKIEIHKTLLFEAFTGVPIIVLTNFEIQYKINEKRFFNKTGFWPLVHIIGAQIDALHY